jgi:hypothetical protein
MEAESFFPEAESFSSGIIFLESFCKSWPISEIDSGLLPESLFLLPGK